MAALETLPDIPVSRQSRDRERPRVREAKFGDGYVQTAPDGIHSTDRDYEARWRAITKADAARLIAFFREHGGHRPFLFRVPDDDVDRRWRCKEWSRDRMSATHANVRARFVEHHGAG